MAAPAAAQQAGCVPHKEAVEHLAEAFGERLVSFAITSEGTLLEVMASQDGSTWTILLTQPGGRACLVSAGTDWHAVEWKVREMFF